MITSTAHEISPPQAVDKKDYVDRYVGRHLKTYVKARGRYSRIMTMLEVKFVILHKLGSSSFFAVFFRVDRMHIYMCFYIVSLATLHV